MKHKPLPGNPEDIVVLCHTAIFSDAHSAEIYCLGTDVSDHQKHLYQREFTATHDYGWKDLRSQNGSLNDCTWVTVTAGSGKFTRTVSTGSGRSGETTVAEFNVDETGDNVEYEQIL